MNEPIAQTMLNGGRLVAPAYPGERLWYNPHPVGGKRSQI
jgi:hypothetical protein